MRVLLVSQEMPPQTGWGGIGTYVDVLSEALAAAGTAVDVLSVAESQPATVERRGGVTVYRFALPPVARPAVYAPETWRRLLLCVSVARLLPKLPNAPDVIECPEWMAEGLTLAVLNSIPLVVRLHSSARQLFRYTGQGHKLLGLDGRVAARLEEISARRANVVVSTRSNLAEVADALRLDPLALHVIPYPVRLPERRPMPDPALPRVAFVGRLEPRKAPEVVLAAVPHILAAVPDARFVFVGRDVGPPEQVPSSTWLRREADRLGVTHAIQLTGQLDRAGVEAEMQRATVCAFPSRWESFGNVVAEASAVGRPVVVSPIAPFRELVRDGVTGRIVDSEDPQAWAATLVELLRDEELSHAMGKAGADHVAALSAPSRVAELAHEAYTDGIERWLSGLRAGLPRRKPIPRLGPTDETLR
jgi:glycosyltransferase involved in cell wall biosynthesis